MDNEKFVTFRLKNEDFKTLVDMLEISQYKYNLGQRHILENFRKILKNIEN